jgi:hypothetical protein
VLLLLNFYMELREQPVLPVLVELVGPVGQVELLVHLVVRVLLELPDLAVLQARLG